jgi:hypothetical protein
MLMNAHFSASLSEQQDTTNILTWWQNLMFTALIAVLAFALAQIGMST